MIVLEILWENNFDIFLYLVKKFFIKIYINDWLINLDQILKILLNLLQEPSLFLRI